MRQDYKTELALNLTEQDIERTFFQEKNGDLWHVVETFKGIKLVADSANRFNF